MKNPDGCDGTQKSTQSLRVSAICTTLNCVEGLREAIQYFAKRCVNGLLDEIVIVDGGSKDGTWEVLEECAERLDKFHAHRLEGANISQGRNCCVTHANGDVILTFDSGCSYDDDYVNRMISPFYEPSPPGMVGGVTVHIGKTPFEMALAKLGSGSMSMSSHRCTAYLREAFDAVGGYREDVPGGEDTHFNTLVLKKGYSFIQVPEAKAYWRVRGSLSACFKMLRRNTRGVIALGEPSGSDVGYISVAIYVVLVFLIILAFIFPWAWMLVPTVLLSYWIFRMFRKNRWRYFIKPKRFLNGILVITAMDAGTVVGVFLGLKDRFSSR
ncbi:MAG: glycosyltransferase [Planctomycetota bacterium]|jgi:glycosyltransferase involved in cell wall biosynthesis